jgi:hypothetical protein
MNMNQVSYRDKYIPFPDEIIRIQNMRQVRNKQLPEEMQVQLMPNNSGKGCAPHHWMK